MSSDTQSTACNFEFPAYSVAAVVMHSECKCHFYRTREKSASPEGNLIPIMEAFTYPEVVIDLVLHRSWVTRIPSHKTLVTLVSSCILVTPEVTLNSAFSLCMPQFPICKVGAKTLSFFRRKLSGHMH